MKLFKVFCLVSFIGYTCMSTCTPPVSRFKQHMVLILKSGAILGQLAIGGTASQAFYKKLLEQKNRYRGEELKFHRSITVLLGSAVSGSCLYAAYKLAQSAKQTYDKLYHTAKNPQNTK